MSSRLPNEPARHPPSETTSDEEVEDMATVQFSLPRTQPLPPPLHYGSGSVEEAQRSLQQSQNSYAQPSLHGQPSMASTAGDYSDSRTQQTTSQSSRGRSRRPPGVAPLANLLHQEPSSPTHSSASTSPRDRMQISPDTIRAPESIRPRPSSELPFDPTREHLSRPSQSLSTGSYTRPSQGFSTFPDETQPSSSTADDGRYRLRIIQQPKAARACGHGERDRRMIDPPPILQCSLADYDPGSGDDVAKLRSTWNIVHCFLYSVSDESPPDSTDHDVSQIPDPNNTDRKLRRLMGTLHMNPFIGIDPEASSTTPEAACLGSFYIFHDLSCRVTGSFRLHFKLTVVDMDFVNPGSRSSVVASATSDIFEVFSPKEFPGMLPSTELTRELRRQGATVAVRGNEGRPGSSRHRATTSMDEPQAMEE